MDDPSYLYTKDVIIPIIRNSGPKPKRPKYTVKKTDAFQRQYVRCGNTWYVANICTFQTLGKDAATFELAEHCNGAIGKIEFKGTMFALPSLSPLGGMCTSAAFDIHAGQSASQKKITERGCEDVLMHDEISDVAADEKTLLVTTKMMSESIPSEGKNLNDKFVSDVVHTKRLRNEKDGVVDFTVSMNIPAIFSSGVVEVLSATFFNDILMQLIRKNDAWEVMNSGRYKNSGFVIARSPEIAMGVVLVDWPRGAVFFPPKIAYKEFEEVNRWSVLQQLGHPANDSVKIPGGVYAWRFKILFGSIFFVTSEINKIKMKSHGKEYISLYKDDIKNRKMCEKYMNTKHEKAYPYL